jgi:hypothetical protein
MNVPDVIWDQFDRLSEREDGLFKSLESAEGQTHVIVNVCLVSDVWISFDGFLHCLDASSVLLIREEYKAKLIENLRVVLLAWDFETCFEILDRVCEVLELEVGERSVDVEVDIRRGLDLNCFIKVRDRFLVISHCMTTETKSILNSSIGLSPWQLQSFSKVILRVHIVFRLVLGDTSVEVRERGWGQFD